MQFKTKAEAWKHLEDYVDRLEDQEIAANDDWLRQYPCLANIDKFGQHPQFLRDNALWVVAGLEAFSFIGMMWCARANFWCAVGAAFFIAVAMLGLWIWDRVERYDQDAACHP